MKNREYELESGHSIHNRIALTTTGEVIRLSEYCCRLANNPNVHVVLLADSNDAKHLDEDKFIHPSVRGKASWNELNLQERQGLARVHYFYWCNVKDTFELVNHRRQALN